MNRRQFTTTLVASSALAACQNNNAQSLIGMQLPVVKGVYVDGSGFDLSLSPQPAIIKFWGLWCGPCMTDMPNWFSLVRQLRAGASAPPDINIFTIHVGQAPAAGPTLRQWTADQQADVKTPIVDDASRDIMNAVGITGTPSTLYIDTQGRISAHAWQFKNEQGVTKFVRTVTQLHANSKFS